MSADVSQSALGGVTRGLKEVVWGRDDTRVRALWRVLLAMPLLWMVTGGVLAGNVQSAIGAIPVGQAQGSGLAQSLLHAGFFLLVLIPWARYLDRYPLSHYGVSASSDWVRDCFLGFVAVLVGLVVWAGLSVAVGSKTAVVSPSVPEGSVLWGLALPFVAFLLHAAVQQVVFFRVILKTAAEGLGGRGVTASRAALGAVPVAVLLFVLMHELSSALRVFDIAVAGTIYGLLYLQTGELALGIGAHFGALFGGTVLFAVVEVTGSLPGILGTVDQYGFPKMVIAYLAIAAWVRWRQGDLSIQPGIARRAVDR
jgi:hypothetical protein